MSASVQSTLWRATLRRVAPSPILTRYLMRLFLGRFVGILALLVVVLEVLGLMGKSSDIMAAAGATHADILAYAVLRAPGLITKFTPFATLLAILFTLARLSQSGEITVMRAGQLSAHQILFPIGLACFLITPVYFVFHNLVGIKATGRLIDWEARHFSHQKSISPGLRKNVWMLQGRDFIKAYAVQRFGDRYVLDHVTIYRQGKDGLLQDSIRADFAWYDKDHWRLFGLRRLDKEKLAMMPAARSNWTIDAPPERFFARALRPESASLSALMRTIRLLRREGSDSALLESVLYHRFAAAAASLVMPLLGAIAGFGVYRAGAIVIRILIGMGLGFGFFVTDNLMLAMGKLGTIPPLAAAFFPLLIFLLIGFYSLFLLEE
jgi:lipopolysaccharide export system permease protein